MSFDPDDPYVVRNDAPFPVCDTCLLRQAPYEWYYDLYGSGYTWDSEHVCEKCAGDRGLDLEGLELPTDDEYAEQPLPVRPPSPLELLMKEIWLDGDVMKQFDESALLLDVIEGKH